VGELKKGINPSSINLLNFDSKYLPTVIKAGLVTGLIALAVSTQFLPISTFFFW
jgi:sulfate transporter 3